MALSKPSDLNRKAKAVLASLQIILAAFLFLPAGTLNYWQGWVFLAVFFSAALAISAYLMKNNPTLLERRSQRRSRGRAREKSKDHTDPRMDSIRGGHHFSGDRSSSSPGPRFHLWYPSPEIVWSRSDTGSYSWCSGKTPSARQLSEVQSGQTVVSSGPYGLVRHPKYQAYPC